MEDRGRVVVVASAYGRLPVLAASMAVQTYLNFRCHIIHDGPDEADNGRLVRALGDPRITWEAMPKRTRQFGHDLREIGLVKYGGDADFVAYQNEDNFVLPRYLEEVVAGFDSAHVRAVYYDCLHDYVAGQPGVWTVLRSRLAESQIDLGCLMVRGDVARQVGFPSRSFFGDWHWIKAVIDCVGADAVRKIDRILYVHS